VLDINSAASQCCDEVDLGVVEEVVLPAGEARVGFLLNLEHDIAGKYARRLVALPAELDLGAALNSPVDVDVEDLAVDNSLLAEALLATILILDGLTLAIAVWAYRLEALDHGAHLAHHCLHALAITALALLDSALLAAAAVALGADDGALERQLGDLAAVDILERDLVDVVDRLGLCRAALMATHAAAEHATEGAAEAAATTKELCEHVLGRHASAAASAALKAGLAILVVDLAFLGIGQDLVGV
jgi:hypothetical protein